MIVIPEQNKLNMGSGFKRLNGHWNVDSDPITNPDQIWDFENIPWPWEDNFFEGIHANNVLEHLGPTPTAFANIMKEMYRVSKDQAEWFICVPHHRCDLQFDDFTHVRTLTAKTFKMFDQTYNQESINNQLSDSVFGLSYGIDIETLSVDYDLIPYWKNLLESGMIGSQELNIKMNTMSNVAQNVTIFCKVHKPGRIRAVT